MTADAPEARAPVQLSEPAESPTVPTLAAASALYEASSSTPASELVNAAAPKSVPPEFVAVTVNVTTAPPVVAGAFAVTMTVRPGTSTSTVAVQRASVPPAGQLLPAEVDTTVLARCLSPVTGSRTVTE